MNPEPGLLPALFTAATVLVRTGRLDRLYSFGLLDVPGPVGGPPMHFDADRADADLRHAAVAAA
jgi:hypothetical protein